MRRTDGTYQKKMHRWESGPLTRFLTFSCYLRLPFFDPELCACFAESLLRCKLKYAFGLLAWVIMPEHIHLIIEPPRADPPLTPQILRSLKQPVAQAAMQSFSRRGLWQTEMTTRGGERSFWQPGGGFDRNVRSLEELRRHIAYIHNNPVERGLVKAPTDWELSSARWCAGMRGQSWGERIPIDKSRVEWGLQEV